MPFWSTKALEESLCSKADIAVSLRMLRVLGDISGTVEDPRYRGRLHALGMRIMEGCAEKLTEEEVKPMRVRLAALEKSAAAKRAESVVG